MKKGFGFCLAGALFLSGCALLPDEDEGRSIALVAQEETPQYTVEQVQYRDLQSTQLLYATYDYMGNEEYRFEVSGVLGSVCVRQGDRVEKGQLLACLDTYEDAKAQMEEYTEQTAQLESEQEQLRAQMELCTRRADILHRYGALTDSEYASEQNRIELEYGVRLREIEDALYIGGLRLDEAEKCMEESAIVAQRDGIVSYAVQKAVFSGESFWQYESIYGEEAQAQMELMNRRVNKVTPETTIVSVAELGTCAFACETDYTDYFQVDDHVKLTIGESTQYSVVVIAIEDGTVYFQLTEPDQSVSVGTTARYMLVLDGREHVLSVSTTSLHETDDGYYVYYVDEAGLRQMKTVEVGVIGNVYAEITGGLKEGDLVIKR